MKNHKKLRVLLVLGILLFPGLGNAVPQGPEASPRLGLFIMGLSGSNQFKTYFDQAPERMRKILLLNGYRTEDLVKISEDKTTDKEKKWGREEIGEKKNIEKYFDELLKSKTKFDEAFIFVAAHANGRDDEAMMHLPEEDMMYRELMEKIDAIPAKKMTVVVVAAQGNSWIQKLGKPGRVIVAGNGYRQYDFIPMLFLRLFPDMFRSFSKPDPKDPSKDVQTSLLDVFANTQKKIRHWYKENNLHCTEMALIDANGDKKGDSLFVASEPVNELKNDPGAPKLESEALKGESDEELPVDLTLPDAKAANEIHFIVTKGEKK